MCQIVSWAGEKIKQPLWWRSEQSGEVNTEVMNKWHSFFRHLFDKYFLRAFYTATPCHRCCSDENTQKTAEAEKSVVGAPWRVQESLMAAWAGWDILPASHLCFNLICAFDPRIFFGTGHYCQIWVQSFHCGLQCFFARGEQRSTQATELSLRCSGSFPPLRHWQFQFLRRCQGSESTRLSAHIFHCAFSRLFPSYLTGNLRYMSHVTNRVLKQPRDV